MRQTWLNPRALGLHATVIVVVPGFLWLGWWQLHRALGGNELSWAYTVEWPFFSLYAIFMWWRLVHDVARDRAQHPADRSDDGEPIDADNGEGSRPNVVARRRGSPTQRAEQEMAAYNSYLASLHAGDSTAARDPGDPENDRVTTPSTRGRA